MASGSETRQMTHGIHLRLSLSERAILAARAAHAETTIPTYVRKTVLRLSPAPAPRITRFDREVLAKAWAALVRNETAINRVGTNVNQIARVLNARGVVMQDAITQAMRGVIGVTHNTNVLIEQMRAAIGRRPRP